MSAENDRAIWEKWYPKNWQSDRGLRRCGGAARGLWIEMLNLMIQSPKRGYLLDRTTTPAKAYTVENLAKDVELPVDEVRNSLAELKKYGVYSVDRNGRIFCRRMVKAQRLHEIGKETGKLGGNPILTNQRDGSKPLTRPLSPRSTHIRKKKEDIKERKGGEVSERDLLEKSSRAAPPNTSWSLDQKRDFGWRAVAEAIGVKDGGWEIVTKAADGDAEALRACKRIAKEIGVTFYAGKPNIVARSASNREANRT